MNDETRVPPGTHFSPTPGCIIMILAVIVLGGSLVYAVYRGIEMNREIDLFTESAPVARPLLSPSAEEKTALRKRLSDFSRAALDGRDAELALSALDLNYLIATEPILRDFRGNTRIREIKPEFIVADISQTLNSLLPGRPRYLNAAFHFKADIQEDGLGLSLIDITAPDKEIPRGFIELYALKRTFRLDPENPAFGPALKKIRLVRTEDGRVIVSTSPPRD